MSSISALQQARLAYQPKLPKSLRSGQVAVQLGQPTAPATDQEAIQALFPHTYGQPMVTLVEGEGTLATSPLKVGVVLSGGQAPGGHNVIAGLYHALKAANPASQLFGFLKGPKGIITGKYQEITDEIINAYMNTGGFNMIMSGRDKIEKPADLQACKANLEQMELNGLVVVGGDDSNTNAAILAEYLLAQGCATRVIGVPKTIDGDMKNAYIEASFGFDTAARTYSELIGNICRDAQSAVKYWHFIRLMGRAASHVALECALQTQPNITLISEEIQEKGTTLQEIIDGIVDAVVMRSRAGKNYGILLVPEGLPEFIQEIRVMIDEISAILGKEEAYIQSLPDHAERVQHLNRSFTDHSARVYGSLPVSIQEVLLTRDSHGNVPLSQVETERLLIDLVGDRIKLMNSEIRTANASKPEAEQEKEIKFAPLNHFFGYEGRCAFPSNFDADYCYSLGYTAAQLVRAGVTGYTATVRNLTQCNDQWVAGGVPVTMMLNMEIRKGKPTPVIKKALVDLQGEPFKYFAANRDAWMATDAFNFPGPIQYFGPAAVCDQPTVTLALEKGVSSKASV